VLQYFLLAVDRVVELADKGDEVGVGEGRDARHLRLVEPARIIVAVAQQHFQLLFRFLDRLQGGAETLGGVVGIALGQLDQGFKCGRICHDN
jgi:hypothetical protein